MQKRKLGNSNLEVSPVGLGCMDSALSKITVKGARLSEDHMKLIDR